MEASSFDIFESVFSCPYQTGNCSGIFPKLIFLVFDNPLAFIPALFEKVLLCSNCYCFSFKVFPQF